MPKFNSILINRSTIFIVIGMLFLNFSAVAQHKILLDSVKNIFRAQPEKALILIEQIKKNANKIKDLKTIVEVEIIKGNIYYFSGKHNEALKIYLDALAIAEQNKLPEQI